MQIKFLSYWEFLIFLVCIGIFGSILTLNIITDIQLHIRYILNMLEGTDPPPANFLYFLCVYLVALMSSNPVKLSLASMLVLSLAVSLKFSVSRAIASRYLAELDARHQPALQRLILASSVSLLFLQCLPSTDYFISGQIPPNVWHNSTCIFVMPFALLLFWQSWLQLREPNTAHMVWISVLCVINLLIKPSFLFVFVVAYPIMLFLQFRLTRQLWFNLLPIAFSGILIALMYYLIYQLSFSSHEQVQTAIQIRPFSVWSHYSANIPLSLLCSLVFPLTYLACYGRDLFSNRLLQYAVLAYAIAVLIAALFTETGAREFHGNFFWQAIICSYILFLVTSMLAIEKLLLQGWKKPKNQALILAFLLHVMAGVAYLGKLFYFGDYS